MTDTDTVPCRWDFDGVTYAVDLPTMAYNPSTSVYDDVDPANLATAERACVYAAMCDGIDDPETLSFARRSIGLGKDAIAARFGMSTDAFTVMENDRDADGRASYVCLLRMMVKLSDRGTFAVRRVG